MRTAVINFEGYVCMEALYYSYTFIYAAYRYIRVRDAGGDEYRGLVKITFVIIMDQFFAYQSTGKRYYATVVGRVTGHILQG